MNHEEKEELARLVADRVAEREQGCAIFTEEEVFSVRELLKTKKNAIKIFLFIFGAVALYAIRDIYVFIVSHFSFK